MKLQLLTVLYAVLVVVNAHDVRNARHANLVRQAAAAVSPAAPPPAASSAAPAAPAGASAAPPASSPPASAATPVAASPSAASPAASGPNGPLGVPPLASITSGMPADPTMPVPTLYPAGAVPSYSGAPPLPTAFVYSQSEWPQMDVVAPTDSPQVKQWLQEIEGVNIPDLTPTKDGDCGEDPAAAADAQNRGWWTCGGWTRSTDIVACPDKMTWGVSFDDGPSDYTQTLLNYLDKKDLTATFFVVGSRAIERPTVLVEEYMKGHELSVHTWSHHALTSLTNEQVVAELGWAREAIRRVVGVTPTTMRPPFGDIDDRVRAISLAMGLTPIIWTAAPSGIKFDTNDWRVAGGQMTGLQQFQSFQDILGNASVLNTGFIVLEHDLFDITVELATEYTLDSALTHQPPFKLEPIGQCNKIPMSDMYMETTTNKTYLAQRQKALSGSGSNSTSTGKSGDVPSGSGLNAQGGETGGALSSASFVSLPMLGALAAGAFAFLI